MVLRRTKLAGVFRRVVIQDLQFDGDVSGIALERRTNAKAVVRAVFELELELKDEVRVFLLGEQPPSPALRAKEHAILDAIVSAI